MTSLFLLASRTTVARSFTMLVPLLILSACTPGEPLQAGLGPNDTDVTAVVVVADRSSIAVGESVLVRATARNAAGQPAPAEVDWTADGGTLVAVTDSTVQFSATTAGTYRVRGRHRKNPNPADSTTITVDTLTPVLQAVILIPSSASLAPGATQLFSVSGQWSNGATTAPSVTYSATGGTITAGGLYTAGSTAGTFWVIATQQGGSPADTSSVTLTTTAPVLQAVILTPASASMATGATQQFSVSGQWSNGATTAPSVTYSATGGTISSGGLYSAGSTAGTFRVIAVQQGGTLADTSAVTLTAPVLQAVILTPASASLATGATQQFAVSGQWSNGATTAPAVTYSATGGTISSGGLYAAGSTAGTFRVIATQQGATLADTSTVSLAVPPVPGSNPNEPSGMTVGFDEPFSVSPVGQDRYHWYVESGASNVSVVNDPTAPVSGQSVLQLKFPSGMPGGNGPMSIVWNELGRFPANTGTLYMRLQVKISSDWSNGGNGIIKFFWPRPESETTAHYVPLSSGSDQLQFGFNLQASYLGGKDFDYFESVSHTKGAWHDLELVLYQGTSGAANNGTIKVWVDGVLTLNQSGVKYLFDAESPGWKYLTVNPTFGGGTNPVPHEEYIWIDQWYASVK